MIAADLARAIDPVLFAEHALGVSLDDWQARALRSSARRQLWNVTRQGAKSTTAALAAVWTAVYRPGSLTLVISPSLRQSSETFRKCLDAYRTVSAGVDADAETLLRLELQNGSRVISLPGSETTTRGFSAPVLIVVDEASRVEDDVITALSPMQATLPDARLIALSTPAGRRGWWYRAWEDGGPDWERWRVPASDVPRIGASFLELERRTMPAARFRQEYECSFEESDAAVFASDAVAQAIDVDEPPLALESFSRWTA